MRVLSGTSVVKPQFLMGQVLKGNLIKSGPFCHVLSIPNFSGFMPGVKISAMLYSPLTQNHSVRFFRGFLPS